MALENDKWLWLNLYGRTNLAQQLTTFPFPNVCSSKRGLYPGAELLACVSTCLQPVSGRITCKRDFLEVLGENKERVKLKLELNLPTNNMI